MEEIGFVAEEIPEIFRCRGGYDLEALISYLAWKLSLIEDDIKKC